MRTAMAVFALVIIVTIFSSPVRAGAVTPTMDYGDAPDPAYPTLLANDGARHDATGPMLGTARDPEIDGQPTVAADGDDAFGTDDEDGVVFTSPYIPGDTVSLKVTASGSGLLNAWVDFNMDGDWSDAGEQIFTDEPLVTGANSLVFGVPAGAVAGTAPFARFRLNTAGGLGPGGQALDGEVEDHRVVETDTGGGGGGSSLLGCGAIARPGEGSSGPLHLVVLAMSLWAMRRWWLARAG